MHGATCPHAGQEQLCCRPAIRCKTDDLAVLDRVSNIGIMRFCRAAQAQVPAEPLAIRYGCALMASAARLPIALSRVSGVGMTIDAALTISRAWQAALMANLLRALRRCLTRFPQPFPARSTGGRAIYRATTSTPSPCCQPSPNRAPVEQICAVVASWFAHGRAPVDAPIVIAVSGSRISATDGRRRREVHAVTSPAAALSIARFAARFGAVVAIWQPFNLTLDRSG